MSIVKVTNLEKKFGDFHAVKGVSFNVEKGEIFGVLGPNGAGKSTTINVLATVLLPTSGTAVINGLDVVKNATQVREKIGLCTAVSRFIWQLNPVEILNYYAGLYGLSGGEKQRRIADLIEFFEISDFKDRDFSQLSTGMKQKVALARSMVNNPEVWFLDEPTNGLDIEVSRGIRRKIKQVVKENGTTVILTSHYLTEVEEMCGRIALFNDGKFVTIGGINEIKIKMNFFDSIYFNVEKAISQDLFNGINGVEFVKIEGKKVLIRARDPENVIGKVIETLERKKVKIYDLEIKRPSLEDVFFKLVRQARNSK